MLYAQMYMNIVSEHGSAYLVAVTSKRAALHRAGVVISGMVELDVTSCGVQTVEHRRKSTSQCQQPVSDVTESHTHAALVGRRRAVA